MTNPNSTTTCDIFDCPADVSGAVGDSIEGTIFPVIIVLAGLFLVAGLAIWATSTAQRYKRLAKLLAFLGQSFRFFGVGLVALVPVGIVAGSLYALTQAEGETQGNIAKVFFIGLGGFALVSLFGYGVSRWWARIRQYQADLHESTLGSELSRSETP